MAVIVQISLYLSYVILAFALAMAGPTYLGMPQNISLGAGFVLYVLLSQGTRLFITSRDKKTIDSKLEAIEFNNFKLESKVDELLENGVQGGDNSKMVEELKMLQTLLLQFVKKEKQLSSKKTTKRPAGKPAVKKTIKPKPAEVDLVAAANNARAEEPVAGKENIKEQSVVKDEPKELEQEIIDDADDEEEIIELSESEIFDDEMSGGRGDVRDVPKGPGVLDEFIGQPDSGRGGDSGSFKTKRSFKKRKIRLIKKESHLLDVMRSGLAENRVDLYLQPIVGLPSRKATFFECFSRVRDEEGNIILPRHYIKLADSSGLSGTLDNLLLFRLIQLIRKMGKRKENLKFFCNLSLSSLEDKEFFPQFVDYMTMNEEFSHRLVFELSKADYEALPPNVLTMMATMGRKGFGFSLDQVDTVDIDVKDLQKKYVRYVKIDSKVLETEFQEDELTEYVTYLRRSGIALVATRVEREAMVLHALDNNVEYAQGYLFSEPVAASEMDAML